MEASCLPTAKHPYGGNLLTNRSAYKILHSEILNYLFVIIV
jgi:hypothetical protein